MHQGSRASRSAATAGGKPCARPEPLVLLGAFLVPAETGLSAAGKMLVREAVIRPRGADRWSREVPGFSPVYRGMGPLFLIRRIPRSHWQRLADWRLLNEPCPSRLSAASEPRRSDQRRAGK